jgi:hypothetical protein
MIIFQLRLHEEMELPSIFQASKESASFRLDEEKDTHGLN